MLELQYFRSFRALEALTRCFLGALRSVTRTRGDAIFLGCIPITWFTPYSGDMVNTFSGTKGFWPGSTRPRSLSKYPRPYAHKPDLVLELSDAYGEAGVGGREVAPGIALLLDAEDRSLDLAGQAIGLPVGSPAMVIQAVKAAVLVAVEGLVAGNSADAELPAKRRHLLAFEELGDETKSLIHRFTLFPGHPGSPPKCRHM